MTPRSIRRAAERRALKLARKTEKLHSASPAISESQLTANRENAQLFTGPITEAGKRQFSLNAVKTGLTGRTVLLPSEDTAPYQAHMQSYQAHFQPVGPEEEALVQSIADTHWRLARVPSLEMSIYARGRVQFANDFPNEEEAVRSALIEAEIYLVFEKQIRNLHLQEARLVRRREKETAELHRLQEERKARESAESKETTKIPARENGFVYSDLEIDPHLPLEPAEKNPLNRLGRDLHELR